MLSPCIDPSDYQMKQSGSNDNHCKSFVNLHFRTGTYNLPIYYLFVKPLEEKLDRGNVDEGNSQSLKKMVNQK